MEIGENVRVRLNLWNEMDLMASLRFREFLFQE